MKCMVCNFEHTPVNVNVHFHRLPKCPTRKKAWLDAIGYRRLRIFTGAVICTYHFGPEAYCGKSNSGICILKDSAVPTIDINLPSTTVPNTDGTNQANEVKEVVTERSLVLDNEFPDLVAYKIEKQENPVDKPVQKEKPIILQSVQLKPPGPIPVEVDLANLKQEVHEKPIILQSVQLRPPGPIPVEGKSVKNLTGNGSIIFPIESFEPKPILFYLPKVDLANFKQEVNVESVQDFIETEEVSTFPGTDTNNLISYETVQHNPAPVDSIELKHEVKYEPVQNYLTLIGPTTSPNATIKTQSESVKTEPVYLDPVKFINRPCEIKLIQAPVQIRPPAVQLAEEKSIRFTCLSIPNEELLTVEEERILTAMRPRLKSLGKLKRMKTESLNKMRHVKALNQKIRRQEVKLAYLKKMVGFMSKNKFLTDEDLKYLHHENIASVNCKSEDDDKE